MTRKPTKTQKEAGVQKRQSRKTAPQAVEIPVAPVKKERRAIIDDPKIGYLTPEEFEAIGRAALGGRGWQRTLMRGTGIAQTTVTRYLRGIFPIPKTIALIMHMLQTLRNHDLPIPNEFFDEDLPKK